MKKVVFVHEPTMGMCCDSKVLGVALQRTIPNIELYSLTIPWNEKLDYSAPANIPDHIRAAAPFDIAFHFEHLYGHAPLRSAAFSRRRIFIPNIEWLYKQDEFEINNFPPAGILHKNKNSKKMMDKAGCVSNIELNTITGWTSRDNFTVPDPVLKKDFRSFLHVKGRSNQKQTGALLNAWLSRPDFPSLTIIVNPFDDFVVPVKMQVANNISIIYRNLSSGELRLHQEISGIHVYPSLMEGFGHSLNEARACRSVLVTTDGRPMRDLVIQGQTGFLIPVNADEKKRWRRTISYSSSVESIITTVEKVLATSVERLSDMGLFGRMEYENDLALFERNISNIFGGEVWAGFKRQ